MGGPSVRWSSWWTRSRLKFIGSSCQRRSESCLWGTANEWKKWKTKCTLLRALTTLSCTRARTRRFEISKWKMDPKGCSLTTRPKRTSSPQLHTARKVRKKHYGTCTRIQGSSLGRRILHPWPRPSCTGGDLRSTTWTLVSPEKQLADDPSGIKAICDGS